MSKIQNYYDDEEFDNFQKISHKKPVKQKKMTEIKKQRKEKLKQQAQLTSEEIM